MCAAPSPARRSLSPALLPATGFAGHWGERAAAVFAAAREGGLAELDDAALLMFLKQHALSTRALKPDLA